MARWIVRAVAVVVSVLVLAPQAFAGFSQHPNVITLKKGTSGTSDVGAVGLVATSDEAHYNIDSVTSHGKSVASFEALFDGVVTTAPDLAVQIEGRSGVHHCTLSVAIYDWKAKTFVTSRYGKVFSTVNDGFFPSKPLKVARAINGDGQVRGRLGCASGKPFQLQADQVRIIGSD